LGCADGEYIKIKGCETMGMYRDVDNVVDVTETPDVSESVDEPSEVEDDISDKYDEYLEDDKSEEFEYKSAEEKDVEEKEAARAEIEEASPYSKEVNDNIRSKEELDVYTNADLKEENVNGRTCLTRDLDMEQKDEFGDTNAERMEKGNAPLSKDGQTVELHHVGQKNDSPLAELTRQEHRGKGNDTIMHDKTKESEIDRPSFDTERQNHWKSRANNS